VKKPVFHAILLPSFLTCVALSAGCAKTSPPPAVPTVPITAPAPAPPPPPPPPPLYTRLGSKNGVAAIVDAFIDDLTTDKRVRRFFAHIPKGPKLDHFKQMLEDQICDIAGGGCHYSGQTMTEAHAGMKITSAQFDAFVSDFQLALEEKQVGKDDAQQLLDHWNLLKDQIVEQK